MGTLSISSVTKYFGLATAVDNVSLEVEAGSFLSLLGPSGCGKTTTLRLIAGLGQPDKGEIRLDDLLLSSRDHLIRPDMRGMSMIFQSYALWPHMTVAENVGYGVKLRKSLRSELKERVSSALSLVRMSQYSDRYPSQLSGGQQQRVALARALAINPTVLLMDEPLSNLDASLREEMRFEIRRLHEEFNFTTVYVTHDLDEALVVSDRIAVMNKGKVEQIGGVEDIYERPQTRFVAGFIGHTSFIRGTAEAPDRLRLGDSQQTVRVPDEAPFVPGNKLLLALRPDDVKPVSASEPRAEGDNYLGGVVVRQVYLGGAREYTILLDDIGQELRMIGSADTRYAPGDRLTVRVPIHKSRVLPDDGAVPA